MEEAPHGGAPKGDAAQEVEIDSEVVVSGAGSSPPSMDSDQRRPRTSTRHLQLWNQVSPTLDLARCLDLALVNDLLRTPVLRIPCVGCSSRVQLLLFEFACALLACNLLLHGAHLLLARAGSSGLRLCRANLG